MLICQLTDLHVRPVGQPVNRVVETNIFTERAFRAVARFIPRPDVVVITGDLTESGLDAEYANVARMLRKWLSMPVFVIPGNHDQRASFREGLRHLPGVTTDICGIAHMDRINLRTTSEFAAVIAGHKQVERIICGHHHRPVVTRVAHAIASIAPSVAHQVELSLDPHDPGAFIFEPPAFQLHRWTPADGIVSHTVYVEDFPGPYPFASDPEAPGSD
jgi:Icc protein